MALLKLALRPGIDKQNTEYGAEGGWVDADYVRFQEGLPEKVGGWQYFSNTEQYFIGTVSEVFTWNSLSGVPYVMIGTTKKVYVQQSGDWYDITPVKETTTTAVFSTVINTDIVTVTDTTLPVQEGDFIIISNVTGNPGGIPNATLEGEYEVQEVLSASTYTIKASVNATGTASLVGTADILYQISIGADVSYFDLGWGVGTWGLSTWGTPRSPSAVTGDSLGSRVWQFDSYGEDVICQLVDGGTYLWDTSVGGTTPATQIAGAPTKSKYALVSTPDRHLVCFGTEDTIGDPTTQDPMYVRFSDQENIADFVATATNTAGGQRLTDGSHIVSAIRSRGQILIFTDTSLHGMQYVGPPYTFGFSQLGTNCGLIGAHAAADVNGVAMWMGQGAFYVFDGTVKKIPCTVQDYVFKDLNKVQGPKVHIGINAEYNEVTWWYCSFTSDYIDRYVTYNYLEGVWSIGTMPRTAWIDTGSYDYPIASEYFLTSTATPVGNFVNGLTAGRSVLYFQEYGVNAIDEPITAYLRSGYFDIGDGDQMLFMKRFIPDYRNFVGEITVRLLLRAFPSATASPSSLDPYIINPTTEKVDTRARGRQISVSMESDTIDSNWRFGTLRVDIQPDGLR
jgi:hypothetical protein